MIDRQGKYTNVEFNYSTGSHTCLPVMVYAYGPGAEQFTGWMQNNELKAKILKACGIEPEAVETAPEATDNITPVMGNFDSKPD